MLNNNRINGNLIKLKNLNRTKVQNNAATLRFQFPSKTAHNKTFPLQSTSFKTPKPLIFLLIRKRTKVESKLQKKKKTTNNQRGSEKKSGRV